MRDSLVPDYPEERGNIPLFETYENRRGRALGGQSCLHRFHIRRRRIPNCNSGAKSQAYEHFWRLRRAESPIDGSAYGREWAGLRPGQVDSRTLKARALCRLCRVYRNS